jgi:hypothetical protein
MTVKRPAVVEAWLFQSRTPFITERLVNGKIRQVVRLQIFNETAQQEDARMRALYGNRWKGIRPARAKSAKAGR